MQSKIGTLSIAHGAMQIGAEENGADIPQTGMCPQKRAAGTSPGAKNRGAGTSRGKKGRGQCVAMAPWNGGEDPLQ